MMHPRYRLNAPALFIGLAALAASAPAVAGTVTIYGDANFSGKSQGFGPGKYDVAALSVVGNDSISSIRVPAGMYVTVWNTEGCRYGATIFVADTAQLNANWNDQISCLEVKEGPPVVTLYSDVNFGGASQTLGIGSWGVGSLSIGNDSLSSIRVPVGFYVVVFEDDNFGGRSLINTGDRSDFGQVTFSCLKRGPDGVMSTYTCNWNDTVSSIKINPAP